MESEIEIKLDNYMIPKGRKDSRVAIILNKETTTFSLQDMFRHSYVIFSCKCDFNGCTFEFI